jgi:hypothetical protein
MPARSGTQERSPGRRGRYWRRWYELACTVPLVLGDHLLRWQGPQARGSYRSEGSNPEPAALGVRGRSADRRLSWAFTKPG